MGLFFDRLDHNRKGSKELLAADFGSTADLEGLHLHLRLDLHHDLFMRRGDDAGGVKQ